MTTLKDLNLEDFEAAIDSGQQLRMQQGIHVAIGLGPIVFAVIIGFVYSRTAAQPPDPDSIGLLRFVSLVHIAVAFICWTASFIVPGVILSVRRLDAAIGQPMVAARGLTRPITDPYEILLTLMLQAHIVRIALLEGPALFGLVVCLVGTVQGQIQTHPVYWFNTGSTVVLALLLAITYPTRDKLVETFRRKKETAGLAF